MKCFGHPEIDAIGICRACGKGLCSKCFIDTGTGLACQGSCQKAVSLQSAQLSKSTSESLTEAILCVIASGLAIVAAITINTGLVTRIGLMAAGVALFLVSVWHVRKHNTANKASSTKVAQLQHCDSMDHDADWKLEQDFQALEGGRKPDS